MDHRMESNVGEIEGLNIGSLGALTARFIGRICLEHTYSYFVGIDDMISTQNTLTRLQLWNRRGIGFWLCDRIGRQIKIVNGRWLCSWTNRSLLRWIHCRIECAHSQCLPINVYTQRFILHPGIKRLILSIDTARHQNVTIGENGGCRGCVIGQLGGCHGDAVVEHR